MLLCLARSSGLLGHSKQAELLRCHLSMMAIKPIIVDGYQREHSSRFYYPTSRFTHLVLVVEEERDLQKLAEDEELEVMERMLHPEFFEDHIELELS